MNLPTVFLFSGQGSQHYQMAHALYESEPEFRRELTYLDGVFTDHSGESVRARLYNEEHKEKPFDQLIFTHPAIVMVECALAQMLMKEGIVPAAVVGCSLGSFAAAAAAGFISMEETVMIAARQARTVETHCEEGAMCAVLSNRALHGAALTRLGANIAGENFDNHFIVSARTHEMHDIVNYLRSSGLAYQQLPVRYAFHSPWLDQAKAWYASPAVSDRSSSKGREMWCCAAGGPLSQLPNSYFWDAVRKPIMFAQTIARMEERGPWRYLDLGPAGTLATFLKYLLPRDSRSEVMSTLSRFGRDRECLQTVRAAYC